MFFNAKKKIAVVKSTEVNNFKELATLTKKAIGNNTVSEFVGRCGIPNHLKNVLNIINEKITTYPELWLLQKISNGSELRVSFDELRIACGYDLNDGEINLKDIKPFWGGIYWCDFHDYADSVTGGIHPAVITQNNIGNDRATITWAVPLTSKISKNFQPTHIKIPRNCGLEKDSEIIIEQMRVITKRDLLIDGHISFICECPEDIMRQVSIAIMKQAGMVHTKAKESTVSRFLDKLNEYVNKEEESRVRNLQSNYQSNSHIATTQRTPAFV